MDPRAAHPCSLQPQAKRLTDRIEAMAAGQSPWRAPGEVIEIRYDPTDDGVK